MNHGDFVRGVMERTGLDEDGAGRAIECTVQALGEGLSALPAARVRERLPAELLTFIPEHAYGRALTEESFFMRVAELEGVSPGMAIEHAEVVLQEVVGILDPEAVKLLREDLPPKLIEIAAARPSYRPPVPRPVPGPKPTTRASSGTSLSEGRVGSTKPLSEAGTIWTRSGGPMEADERESLGEGEDVEEE